MSKARRKAYFMRWWRYTHRVPGVRVNKGAMRALMAYKHPKAEDYL